LIKAKGGKTKTGKSQKMLILALLGGGGFCFIALAGGGVLFFFFGRGTGSGAILAEAKKGAPKFSVGKETTYLTGPIDQDGFIDSGR
jgi:hypothetical protein